MDERTLTALRGSIQKWEAIVAGTGADHGMDNCPLCQEFAVTDHAFRACHGCPVKARTGQSNCKGTPYIDWFDETNPDGRVTDERTKALAQAELDFLRSLLPEGQS